MQGLATATIQTSQILKEIYYYRHFADDSNQLADVEQALTDAIATHEELQTDLESILKITKTYSN